MIKNWLINRLKEKSTYSGFALILGMSGTWYFKPEMVDGYIAVATGLIGLYNVIMKEKANDGTPAGPVGDDK